MISNKFTKAFNFLHTQLWNISITPKRSLVPLYSEPADNYQSNSLLSVSTDLPSNVFILEQKGLSK